MTEDQFEIRTGHEPRISIKTQPGHYSPAMFAEIWADCSCDCNKKFYPFSFVRTAATTSGALRVLAEDVLNAHKKIAMDRADWRCEVCKQVAPLQAHHKVFRSHGRDDRVENLQCLCARCHADAHGTGGKR